MMILMNWKVAEYSADTAQKLLLARHGVDHFTRYPTESRKKIVAAFLREQPKGTFYQLEAWLRQISEDPASYERFGINPNSAVHKAVADAC